MDLNIRRAGKDNLEDLLRILEKSPLGKKYYPNKTMMRNALNAAIERDLFYIAKIGQIVVGIIWFSLHGAFATYPYLHIISIEESYRGCGIGTRMIEFYEMECLKLRNELRSKSFLVVSEDNNMARHFYERLGYKCLFSIDNLFRKRVTEIVMKKDIAKLNSRGDEI